MGLSDWVNTLKEGTGMAVSGAVDTFGGVSDSVAGLGDAWAQLQDTGVALGIIDAETETPKTTVLSDSSESSNVSTGESIAEESAKDFQKVLLIGGAILVGFVLYKKL